MHIIQPRALLIAFTTCLAGGALLSAQPASRPVGATSGPPSTRPVATRPVRPPPALGEPLGKMPLRDLCRLAVENGQIEIITGLSGGIGFRRPVAVPELGGQTLVSCNDYIYTMENTVTGPDDCKTITKVNVNTSAVIIDQSVQRGNHVRTVALHQARTDSHTGPKTGQVRLTITDTVVGSTTRPQPTVVDAANLAEFRRTRRAEMEQHVRPILRLLRAEHVMAPEPWEAHQVLTERGPDDKVRAAVMDLLARLDADSYQQRQDAAAQLEKMGGHAAAILSRLDRDSLSHEQRLTIDRILKSPRTLSSQIIQSLRNDVHFVLDCLYVDDRDVREAALARLRQLYRDVTFDIDADSDARTTAINVLRTRLAPSPATQPREP